MHIKLSATWLKDKEKHEILIYLAQTTKIEDLRKIVHTKTGVEPKLQRLFYRGKELVDGQILNDYSVAPNDVILLAKRTIPISDSQATEVDTSVATKKEEREEQFLNHAVSLYYSAGEHVDVRDQRGCWFEAKILDIFIRDDGSHWEEEDLIFKIRSDKHVSVIPYEDYVGFENIRPVSYYNYKIPELKVGMTVLANYNVRSPKERGDWFDFRINDVDSIDIYGDIMLGDVPALTCNIKFIQEFMRIEEPTLLEDQPRVVKLHKRKYPYHCNICKDDMTKECQACSCSICSSKENLGQIILCDECDKEFHIYCLEPPLETVPDGDWYCSSCKTDTSEIVNPGEKLKVTKNRQKKNSSNKEWGRGMACVGVTERNDMIPKNHVGPVPGVEVGTCWKYREGAAASGVHRPIVAGIHGQSEDCAYSVVLSGGYEDDVDNGKEFYYTGSGGRNLKEKNLRTGHQSFDQELTRTNKALAMNCNAKFNDKEGAKAKNWKQGKPVRVVRSYKLNSEYAPKEGFRYDGTYKVVKYFRQKGQSGYMVWRYLLRRDDPTPAPWEKGGQTLDMIYPANYWAIQEEKKKMKEEQMRLKKEQNQKAGTSGTSKRKRKQSSDCSDSDKTPKKPKVNAYKLNPATLKAIDDDIVNEKLWLECKNATKEGQKAFMDKVKESFVCIICRSLVYDPLTLKCSLNICLSCTIDSLKHCDTEDFFCPHCRENLGEILDFAKTIHKVQNDKLKTALNMIFPGYGKA